jgi:hemerythrin-like domain-containing protein
MSTEPTGLFLAHRAMLRDLDRMGDLTTSLTGQKLDRRRAHAIAGYLDDLCTSIHHHHSAEDDVLWPVLEKSAGAHVDLTELSDDHSVLDPKLHRVRTGATALRRDGVISAALAADMADIRETLHEHIADEEKTIIPLIRRYVSQEDWDAVEAQIRKRGAKMSFEVPRVLAVTTKEELDEIKAEGGLPVAVMLKILPPAFRRRERRVFGYA